MNALTQCVVFCLVGCANTAIDVGLFNLLTRKVFRSAWALASLLSCSAAMAFSFTANSTFVFPVEGRLITRGSAFLLVTLVSSFGIQSAVIVLARRWPLWRADRVVVVCNHSFTLSSECLERNKAKAMAVAAGMFWNFVWYKFYVFA